MSALASVTRRLDHLGRSAMLVGGLAAQAAMWVASHHAVYPIGGAFLVVVAMVTAAEPPSRSRGARRLTAALKLAACVGLIGACVASIVGSALHDGKPPSTTDAVGALLLIAHLVQAATATSRRDVTLGAPLVAAMLLQAGVAASGAAPAVPFAVAIAATIGSLATLHRAELLASARVSGDLAPARRILAQLGGAAACGCLVFLALPTSAQVGVHTGQHPPATAAGALDLRSRAPLSDAVVFTAGADAPAYWQGQIYDHYDGITWTVTPSQTTKWTPTPTEDPDRQAMTLQDRPAAARVEPGTLVVTRTDSVVTAQPLDVVLAPGQAVSYAGPGTVESDASGNVHAMSAGLSYQVQSVLPAATQAQLDSAAGTDPADQRWLQLPPDLPTRVSMLAAQASAGRQTRAAQVSAVEDFLRSRETYDLAAPEPAPGTDAVDDFLFVSHRGFCEQFASAAVVMLRTLGIPARLVTGYAHGDTTTEPGKTVFRESDAHAWVQVWYPGVGWIDSDATPLATPAAHGAPSPASAAKARAQQPWPPFAVVAALWPANSRARVVIGGGVALAILIAGLLLGLRRGRRTASQPLSTPSDAPPYNGPVLAAYLRLTDNRPSDGAAAGKTLREAVLRLDEPTVAAPQLRRALDLLERECYGAEPLSPDEVDAAVTAFSRLARL
jgi:transglutaminase-like putative cysteine protease